MTNIIPNVLTRARDVFRNLGIQPPYWLIQVGRRLYDKYSDIYRPTGSQASLHRPHVGQLEAKVDHILWSIERMEATLYLQSLQSSIQPVPLQDKQPLTEAAVIDTNRQL
jgi:hypothetical protein